MRKTIRKETSNSEAGVSVAHISEGKTSEEEWQETGIEDQINQYIFKGKSFPYGNTKGFSRRFDSLDFSDRDSKIFSLNGSRNSSISTFRSVSDNIHKKIENPSFSATAIDTNFTLKKPTSAMSKKSRKLINYDESMEWIGSNLVLRKTDEVSDFNFKNIDDSKIKKENKLKRAVEWPVVADEYNRTARKSDLTVGTSGTELSLYSANPFVSQTEKQYNQEIISCFPARETRRKQGYKNDSGSSRSSKKKRKQIEEPPKRFTEKFVESEVPPLEDILTKKYFRDLCIYSLYLIVLTTIALSMVTSEMYFFSSVTSTLFMDSYNRNASSPTRAYSRNSEGRYLSGRMIDDESDLLPTLKQGHSVEDFWGFVETTMLDLFYWNFYYFQVGVSVYDLDEDKKMYFENQILGVPRMRQVRVTNHSCKIHPAVRKFFRSCYYYYTPFTEDVDPIMPDMESKPTATAWVYTNARDLNSTYYEGEVSTYGGGGYYLDLDRTKEASRKMIDELKANNWITKATRAVFIDFNIYNANVNLFLICKIVVEFPPVGGMIANSDFRPIKAIRYLNPFDFFILGCEFFMVFFTIYFAYELFSQCCSRKSSFFLCFRSYLNLIIVVLLIAAIVINIIRFIVSQIIVNSLEERFTKYTDFSTLKYLHIHFNNVIAVLAFVSWIKLFTFLAFNTVMLEFKRTLALSIRGSLQFLPMFLNAYLAFAILANLLFGDQVKDYATLYSSTVSLFQAFMGDFRYRAIQEANWILGSAFCISFIFFMFFIFLNLFIAIVSHAYSRVKADVYLVKPRICTYAKRGLINTFTCCKPRKRLKNSITRKRRQAFREVREALERAGFSKEDIQIFFAKYNINVSNILDGEGWRIKEEMELERVDYSDIQEHQINVLRRRLDNMITRMEIMELSLQPIIDKVDMLLDRFNLAKHS